MIMIIITLLLEKPFTNKYYKFMFIFVCLQFTQKPEVAKCIAAMPVQTETE